MAGKKTSGWVKAGKVVLALFMIFCVAIDVWYVLIYISNDVSYSVTGKADVNVLDDGSVVPIMEVNYYNNKNQNGREMFELNFNSILDENRTSVYSQGYQLLAAENSTIQWGLVPRSNAVVTGWKVMFGIQAEYKVKVINGGSTTLRKYQSADNYQHVTGATHAINDSTRLKITMGSVDSPQIYALQFKGENVSASNESCRYGVATNWATGKGMTVVACSDPEFLCYLLWNSLRDVPAVTDSMITFKFADIFQYYKCTDEGIGKYESFAVDSSLVKYLTDNYFGIKVTVHDDGVRRASDSMFHIVDGDSSYNTTGDYSSDEYFYGQQVIKADIYDFNLVNVSGNQYLLKLKDSFIDYYKQYSDEILLEVEIDLDLLKSKNLNFAGFTVDSGLENFKIYRCYTKETKGEQVEENDVEWQIDGHNLAMEVAA